MTAFDRQQVIEDAARTLKAHDADRMECLSDHKLCCPAGDHDFTNRYLHEASTALPVIATEVLKPIREQVAEWREFMRDPDLTGYERSAIRMCASEMERLLDQIKAATKGGE